MATSENSDQLKQPIMPTREPDNDIIKGAKDTSSIDAPKQNSIPQTDHVGNTVADVFNATKSKTTNEAHDIDPDEDEETPLTRGI